MPRVFGYARVSSTDQNLDRQLKALKDYGVSEIYADKSSGKNLDRPEFKQLDAIVQKGDTIVILSMDRFARSLQDLLNKVTDLTNRGVAIKFLKENITVAPDNISPISRLLLGVMGAVAEFERNMIRERQREGIELAKKRGVYKGRSPVSPEKLLEALKLMKSGMPKSQICRKLKIGRTTFYKYMNEICAKAVGTTEINQP